MDARLAFEAATLGELAASLRAFLDGNLDYPGLHHGNVQDHRAVFSALAGEGDDIRDLVRGWAARGSLRPASCALGSGIACRVGRAAPHRAGGESSRFRPIRLSGSDTGCRCGTHVAGRGMVARRGFRSTISVPSTRSGAGGRAHCLPASRPSTAPSRRLCAQIVATLPDAELLPRPFDRWRRALCDLLPSGKTTGDRRGVDRVGSVQADGVTTPCSTDHACRGGSQGCCPIFLRDAAPRRL